MTKQEKILIVKDLRSEQYVIGNYSGTLEVSNRNYFLRTWPTFIVYYGADIVANGFLRAEWAVRAPSVASQQDGC